MIEAIVGTLSAIMTVYVGRSKNAEHWLYTACLVSLPLIYMDFGLFADAKNVILSEFLYGLPYFVAIWLAHAGYDVWHSSLFINRPIQRLKAWLQMNKKNDFKSPVSFRILSTDWPFSRELCTFRFCKRNCRKNPSMKF